MEIVLNFNESSKIIEYYEQFRNEVKKILENKKNKY